MTIDVSFLLSTFLRYRTAGSKEGKHCPDNLFILDYVKAKKLWVHGTNPTKPSHLLEQFMQKYVPRIA